MNEAMSRTFTIRPATIGLVALAWLVSEVAVFILVVDRIGFGGAFLIGLGALILGLAILRRIGFAAVRKLRNTVEGTQPTTGSILDGSLAALGAVLLIIPGFISDVVGLALAAPSIRQWLAHRFAAVDRPGRPPPRVRTGTIDLEPTDWQRLEDSKGWSDAGRRDGATPKGG